MIIPVKKTLNSAGHIDAKLIDFSEICQKNPAKSAVFYWLFLGEVSPRNFLWNRPIFLRICPWKSFENWLFSAKILRNGPIFLRILTFLPRKSAEIGRLFREFWLFSRENPAKSADFSANLPLKNPRNFVFFSAKHQKPCSCEWRVLHDCTLLQSTCTTHEFEIKKGYATDMFYKWNEADCKGFEIGRTVLLHVVPKTVNSL